MSVDFSVFPGGPISSRVAITVGNSIEAEDISKFLANRCAEEITLDILDLLYPHDPAACLAFMTPEAFAYFLPAWMKIALDDYDVANTIPETIISYLLALAEGKDPERLSTINASYTREQLGAVAKFLREMSVKYWHFYPSDDALKALMLYWHKYEQL